MDVARGGGRTAVVFPGMLQDRGRSMRVVPLILALFPSVARAQVSNRSRQHARVIAVILSAGVIFGCAIHSYEIVQQPTAVTLSTGIGGQIFRIERSSDLHNAFGAASISGDSVDQGFVELVFAGVASDGRLILRFTNQETRSNETSMSRHGVGDVAATASTTGNWTTASGVYIPPRKGETLYLPSNTIEFLYDTSSGTLLIAGIEVTFVSSTPQSVRFWLRDARPPK